MYPQLINCTVTLTIYSSSIFLFSLLRMDKDGDVKITWEEWRDFLLLHPNTNWKEISKVWRHATVSIYLTRVTLKC